VPETSVLDRALKLLARRSRTALELDHALAKAGIPEPERQKALARLRELGYINDPETARMRAQTRVALGDAPRFLRRRLEAQGIEPDVAKEAAAEAADGAGEDELVAKALQRRLRGRKPADMREKQRLVRALAAKGHRPSAVARALGIDWEGDDGCDDP
jgi:regulatory protein